jgi:hypothetical protein
MNKSRQTDLNPLQPLGLPSADILGRRTAGE